MKSKEFIKKSEYPGGQSALRKFVLLNLRYPSEALINKIEGKVHLKYEVNEKGRIHSITIINSLGYGCDQEAIRIIKLLKYPKVNNRGIKVNTKLNLSIDFTLPTIKPSKINYIYTKK